MSLRFEDLLYATINAANSEIFKLRILINLHNDTLILVIYSYEKCHK